MLIDQTGIHTEYRWTKQFLEDTSRLRALIHYFQEDPSVDIEEMTEIEMLTADDNGKILIPKASSRTRETFFYYWQRWL